MKKTLRILLAASAIATTITTAHADVEGLGGTLKAISDLVDTSLSQTEQLYQEKKGQSLDTPIDVTASDAALQTYLKPITGNQGSCITTDQTNESTPAYHVLFTLRDSFDTIGGNTVPFATELQGARFLFIPITGATIKNIIGWQCVTDGDGKLMGNATPEGSRTHLTDSNTSGISLHLQNCTYMTASNLSSYITATPCHQ